MAERIFVKVMGFSDVERHALNTVFRLSEQRSTVYALWQVDAPEPPKLALIDGQSHEAARELESPKNAGLKLIWVGEAAPAPVWRTFGRPLSWPDVVKAMDELFAPSEPLDFDLGFGDDAADPEPPDTLPPGATAVSPRSKRALIASADPTVRLYLRARLALADLTQADDAESGAQALELVRSNHYSVALVDFGLPDLIGWAFLKELAGARPAIPHLIITTSRVSMGDRLRGWRAGVEALFEKPVDPEKLQALLKRV